MSITTTSSKKSFFNGRKMWFVLSAMAFVLAAAVIFVLLQAVTATATYYVLNKDLPARSIITQAELTAVTTSEGGQPRTALNLGDVLSSQVYTKYSLHAGDILTTSNSGALTSLNKGLPKDFVVASFKAAPSVAAGGKIQRGDYVDIFAINPDTKGSHLFLQRALIVDATSDLDTGASTPANGSTSTDATGTTAGAAPAAGGKSVSAADSSAYRSGIPVLFTVGLSQTDAAKLAVASKGDMYVVLSSTQSASNGASNADVGAGATDIFSGSVGDAGTGTDNTFGQSGKKSGSSTSPSPSASPSPSSSTDPNPGSSSPSSTNLVPSPAPSPSGTSKTNG